MADTVLSYLNHLNFQPILKPGYIVHVLPDNKYGYYLFPKDSFVEPLPEVQVNMASASNTLGAIVSSGQQPTIRAEIDDLDMPRFELAQYRMRVIDDVLATVFQPSATGRFNNLTGPLPFDKGSTDLDYQYKDSLLPEIFVFDQLTRPTIQVQNTKYRATAFARVAFKGFRYPLVELDKAPADGSPSLTLSVEGKSN